MAENTVGNRVCSTCGADVRPQALFCYSCGSSVAPEIENNERVEATDNARFQEEIVEPDIAAAKVTTNLNENHDTPIEKPFDTLVEDKAEKKSPLQAETKLKSAAALRRGARTPAQKKTVEVVWEEPENAPNIWFLLAAFILALFAVGILLAMLYIR